MSNKKNPIEEKIASQQEKINKDGELKKKKERRNTIVIVTSLLLLSGVIMGIARILMHVLTK